MMWWMRIDYVAEYNVYFVTHKADIATVVKAMHSEVSKGTIHISIQIHT